MAKKAQAPEQPRDLFDEEAAAERLRANPAPVDWRKRIVGYADVDPEQLQPHPDNPKIHPTRQQNTMTEILDQIGMVQNIIVNQRTGYILDGHQRVQLAISKGQRAVPVVYVDLDETEEMAVLYSFDQVARLSGIDRDLVATNAPIAGQIAAPNGAMDQFFHWLERQGKPRPVAREPFAENGAAPDDGEPVYDCVTELIFTRDEQEQFLARVATLMVRYEVDNVTDAVVRAVNRAFEAQPPESVE